jgi:alanyl aminopeptidase
LELAIIPSQAKFSGRTEIDIRLANETRHIWLHGKDITVSRAELRVSSGETIVATYQQMHDSGVALLTLENPVEAGDATLIFEHSAAYNESLEGLYRVKAGDDYYAFTQFEATSARLVFPGFDEPRFKVKFDMTLEIEAHHRFVSNTPAVDKQLLRNGHTKVTLATTRPLPTYLLAFIVGELDEVQARPIAATELRPEPLSLRGYTVKGKGDQIRYALENTEQMLLYLEEYFGTAYPYRKLDIIAVPDFRAGAMENAGAITYREQYILLDESSSAWQKRVYAATHAHELAHQWFGNLVTPLWWNDIWLNEAFANWLSYKTADDLEPGSGYQQSRLASALGAMDTDSLANARRIRQPIETHGDITAAFDSITYQKGGAVLSMFEGFIGEEAFREGIRHYMELHRFGNTDAYDFIRAISAQRPDLEEGLVEKAFFSFLEQPGTPFVSLDLLCDGENIQVGVEQSRYLPVGSTAQSDEQWVLPLCFSYGEDGSRQSQCHVVSGPVKRIELDTDQCPQYIIPNADSAGYYRWALEASDWLPLLEDAPLTDAELLGTADSLSAAFNNGSIGAATYLDTLPVLLESDNREVVGMPLGDLSFLKNHVVSPDHKEQVEHLIDKLYRDKYERFSDISQQTTDNDTRLSSLLHKVIAHDANDELVQYKLAADARAYLGNPPGQAIDTGKLDSNLRQTAFIAAVKQSDAEYAFALRDTVLKSSDSLLRQQLLNALANSNDEVVLEDLRSLLLDERLRINELRYIIRPQMARAEKRDAMWRWILDNFDEVLERIPFSSKGTIVNYAGYFCSEADYKAIATMEDKIVPLAGGKRALVNTLERIQLCYELKNFHRPGALDYFSSIAGSNGKAAKRHDL